MERFISIVKRYPLLIAGAVVALILLIWYMSSDGATTSTIAVIGPSDTTVAANAAIESERIKANASAHAGQIAVELAGIEAGVAESTLSTSKSLSEIQANRDVDIAKIAGKTQTDVATITTGASTSQAQIFANMRRGLADIAAQDRLNVLQFDYDKSRELATIMGKYGAFAPAPAAVTSPSASPINIFLKSTPAGIASWDPAGGQGGEGGNQGNASGGGGPF
jgi:hypothetical protein